MEELEASLQRERESLQEEIRKNSQIMGENRSLKEELNRSAFTHYLSHTWADVKVIQQPNTMLVLY